MNYQLAIRAAKFSELAYAEKNEVAKSFREFRWIDKGPVQGFVARKNGVVWIVFRGTDPEKIKDWIVNLKTTKTNAIGMKGRVHKGFFEAMESVLLEVNAAQDELFQQDDEIAVCGHSQGAALAVLYSARMIQFWPEAKKPTIHLFGCPRVGNGKFAKWFDSRFQKCFRWVNNNDVVARIPLALWPWLHCLFPVLRFLPMGFRHVGQFLYFDYRGRLHKSISQFDLLKDRLKGRFAFWHWLSDGIRDHSGTYAKLVIENRNYENHSSKIC